MKTSTPTPLVPSQRLSITTGKFESIGGNGAARSSRGGAARKEGEKQVKPYLWLLADQTVSRPACASGMPIAADRQHICLSSEFSHIQQHSTCTVWSIIPSSLVAQTSGRAAAGSSCCNSCHRRTDMSSSHIPAARQGDSSQQACRNSSQQGFQEHGEGGGWACSISLEDAQHGQHCKSGIQMR